MPDRFVAEFGSPEDAVAAANAVRALGCTTVDAYTPYPVPALEAALDVPRSRIPFAAFLAGALGCAAAYGIVWWTNAHDYPLDVGGRPLDSIPADVPLMFETAVLLAGLTAFALVLARSGLPRLHHPIMEEDGFERVSLDRFWLVIETDETDTAETTFRDRLMALGAIDVRPRAPARGPTQSERGA